MPDGGLRRLAAAHARRGREDAERRSPGVTALQAGDVVPGLGRIVARDESGVRVDEGDRVRAYSWRAFADERERAKGGDDA